MGAAAAIEDNIDNQGTSGKARQRLDAKGGATEGKHDDPADTKDRLVKIGTKYQATAPAVADGDNIYLLVDSAGRPIIVGPAASDAPATGNPVPIGGVVDDTSPPPLPRQTPAASGPLQRAIRSSSSTKTTTPSAP